jgi:phosphoribosyl-ATP pyrophosphohydrolase/phosphoribosyl-AMP cyclohydrolase
MSGQKEGLIPVVVQDVRNNNVLMVAYADKESLELTKQTGYMHYWSRSRETIWKKGETSGNVQKLREMLPDCDGDALLARVEQSGPACHTGRYSCFAETPFPPEDVVRGLWRVFEDRKSTECSSSYTCKLLRNRNLLLKKIGEESSEVLIAAKDKDKGQIVYESADLLYHLMVLLFDEGIRMEDVYSELERRRK